MKTCAPIFLGIVLSGTGLANEWHAEFRRAVIVSTEGEPRLQTALQKNGFEVLALATTTPDGGAKFRSFLNAIPTNGFAFIYLESIGDAADGPAVLFPVSPFLLTELAKQLQSRVPGMGDMNRHTASRQNVIVIQETQPGHHPPGQAVLQLLRTPRPDTTFTAVRKPGDETDLADIAVAWLQNPKEANLRTALQPHALLSAESAEPVQLQGTAATAISPPERFVNGTKAGDHWLAPGGQVLIWCPPGEFVMGDERFADAPPTRVAIERGFWISKYEFPYGMWEGLGRGWGKKDSKVTDRLTQPQSQVHMGTDKFITLTDSMPAPEGWSWDLPTEAEWEYACRAGSREGYPCALEDLDQYANFADKTLYDDRIGIGNNGQVPATGPIHFVYADQKANDGYGHEYADIGSFRPNAWGIHDMHGNLSEVCAGFYFPDKMTIVANEFPPKTNAHANNLELWRVLRGGAWCHPPEYLHASFRSMTGAADAYSFYFGYRLVLREGPRLSRTRQEIAEKKKGGSQ